MNSRIAIYPGSFDPVTLGHMCVINKAIKLFDKLYVAVLNNPEKKNMFSIEKRVFFLQQSVSNLKQVEIVQFEGLLVDLANKLDAEFIVKGLRSATDFEYEVQMALVNEGLNSDIETIFVTPNKDKTFFSSSIVRQLLQFNGDISAYVPNVIKKGIEDEFKFRKEV